jgi:hypothetical protein
MEEVELQRRLEVGVGDAEEPFDPRVHSIDVVDEHVDAAAEIDRVGDEAPRPVRIDQIDG